VVDSSSYYFYCNLFASGKTGGSDASTLCQATTVAPYTSSKGLSYTLPQDCPTIALLGLGLNKTTFDSLLAVQNPAAYATCPSTTRRLAAPAPGLGGIKPYPNVTRAIQAWKDKINAMTFKEIKHALNKRGKAYATKKLKETCEKKFGMKP
jgi:hypothetical protein